MRLEFAGIGTLPQADGEFVSFAQARPVLEAALYGRVAALAGVQVIHGVRNAAILTSADRGRVAGARYDGASGAFEILADLVVDATGRGRLTEDVLQAAGAPPPERTVVGIDLGYATGVFHIPPRPNHGFQALATFRGRPTARGAPTWCGWANPPGRCCSWAAARNSRPATWRASSPSPTSYRRTPSPTCCAGRARPRKSTASDSPRASGGTTGGRSFLAA